METRKTNNDKPKTKEEIRRHERHQKIMGGSDTNLINLYSAYLELTQILLQIRDKNKNRSDGKIFLLQHEFTRWLSKTEKIVREVYGSQSRDYDIFVNYCEYVPVTETLTSTITRQIKYEYIQSLNLVHSHLEGMVDSYIQLGGISANTNIDKIEHVLEICHNFPRVVKQLSKRHDKREPFTINDEYDVQDLLHALLSVHFADIRDEEYCSSFAGINSRIDFFLKEEGIGIEVKMIQESLRDNKLLSQLTTDLKQYQTHPEIKSLVIFIYDPEHLLNNPQAFINDIPGKEGNMGVNVIISPI